MADWLVHLDDLLLVASVGFTACVLAISWATYRDTREWERAQGRTQPADDQPSSDPLP